MDRAAVAIREKSVWQVIEDFRNEQMPYGQVMVLLPDFSEENQREILKGISQKQKEFWDEQLNYYLEFHPQLPPIPDHTERFIADLTAAEDKELVLDLGCGYGNLICKILNRNRDELGKIIGIDYAPSMLAMAKKLTSGFGPKVDLMNFNLEKGIPLSDKTIGTAFSNWGIVYFRQEILEGVFREIHRVLKPDGELIFSGLIRGTKMAGLKRLIGIPDLIWKGKLIQEALRFERRLKILFPMYSVNELVEMTRRAGFTVLKKYLTLRGRSVTVIASNQ